MSHVAALSTWCVCEVAGWCWGSGFRGGTRLFDWVIPSVLCGHLSCAFDHHSLASTTWPSNLLYTCNNGGSTWRSYYSTCLMWYISEKPGEVRNHLSITAWLIGFCKEKILLPLDPFPESHRGHHSKIAWYQGTVCDSRKWLSKASASLNCDTYCLCLVIWPKWKLRQMSEGLSLHCYLVLANQSRGLGGPRDCSGCRQI